jgi:hypothetical protein
MSRIPAPALETATLATASKSPALLSGRMTRPAINTHQGKSMKVRCWINAAVVALSTMIASASAAPISTMSGLARSDALPITKVTERKHYGSQAYNYHKNGGNGRARQGGRFHGWRSGFATASDYPSADNWNPHDSNDISFGSAQWWEQHPSGRGR